MEHNTCIQCGAGISPGSRFCGNCGMMVDQSLNYADPFRSRRLIWVIAYYGIFLIANLILSNEHLDISLFNSAIAGDVLLVALTSVAAMANFSELRSLFSVREIKIIPMLLVIVGAMLFAVLINLIIPTINQWLVGYDVSYYETYRDSAFPVLFMFISIAVLPAVFEEIAFRGFVFNHLREFTGAQTALIISSFLFSILHLTFVSIFWLLPFALAAGYLRIRYNTLWYGMVAHFIFNSTTCLFTIYEEGILVW